MNDSKLHDFFFLDDSARWKAIAWSIGIGGMSGLFTSGILGMDGAVAVTAFCSLGTLCWMASRYSQATLRPVMVAERRNILKASLIAAMETAAAAISVAVLGN